MGGYMSILPTNDYLTNESMLIKKAIRQIDNQLIYQPATYEFVKSFNRDIAIQTIEDYKSHDSFYSSMLANTSASDKDSQSLDNFSLYFSLLWLKQYLVKRETEILNINCYYIEYTAHQFKNRTTPSCMHFKNICRQIYPLVYEESIFFVPETILIYNSDNLVTVATAVQIIDSLLDTTSYGDESDYTDGISNNLLQLKALFLNQNSTQLNNKSVSAIIDYLEANSDILAGEFSQSIIHLFIEFLNSIHISDSISKTV